VPELERAISLNPDRESEYQIALGRSYLTLDQREKAVEAFDRAIKLSPEPRTWNDVAYMLSLGKIELDKAQQYAESAVSDAATQLRNVDLENLELENLNDVSRLAAYWDTLGWVHFQKGNLDLAEKFLMSTWSLGQYGENGDHLGQLHEKRGKKEEAIRWYSLAAFGRHPVPDSRENLARLVGKEKIESFLSKAKEEYSQFTSLKLGSLLKDEKEKLEAEFYILINSGGTGNPRISGVKFIQGSEKMQTLAVKLKEAKFSMTFPDEAQTKVIRRGTLSCLPRNGECTFVMLHPDDVISVD
jgi:tetratricopeptide (TPR) repeat protein